MAQTIGKNTNFNNSPVINSGVVLNSITSTTLVTLTREDSLLIFTNAGNQDAWIKMQAASIDDDKKGFLIYRGTTTELVLDIVRTDVEISAITNNGNTTLYTTVI